ncbi:MAG: GyrI-like domain-containing protein, partial [Chitinophagaceae bacterium]
PWNIINLFFSLDKKMGSDFETGLTALKAVIEQTNGTTTSGTYEVMTMDFPATTFASIRQKIKWTDIPAFYSQHLPIIYAEAGKANTSPGTPASLYYFWDEKNQEADMAAAIPVTAGSKMNNAIIQMVNIPATKAVFVNYYGAYDKSMEAYNSIDKYLADNKLKQKTPVIEQYITDPLMEKDTAKWLTKIVFLVE